MSHAVDHRELAGLIVKAHDLFYAGHLLKTLDANISQLGFIKIT